MATYVEEAPTAVVSSPPWYGKVFECWRNRNRVGPGRVELPDCDFLAVAPRRTLRVLRPPPRNGRRYYEGATGRPESIDDSFFARWSRRPHPSGDCRCSFRRSAAAGAYGTDEERIISAELNRIRTSLCEADGKGGPRDIEELERRVSVNLRQLRGDANETATEQGAKRQIVKDLERYINTLLEEILDDTVKYVAQRESARNGARHSQRRAEGSRRLDGATESTIAKEGRASTFDVGTRMRRDTEKQFDGGYVNPAFVGSTDGLDLERTAEEHTNLYLAAVPASTDGIAPEQLDCVDSGINSVETIEFQPDQEPSFEQSLLRIIDEKLGRGPAVTSDPDEEESDSRKAIPSTEGGRRDAEGDDLELAERSEDVEFAKLRLELRDRGASANGTAAPSAEETPPVELEDYRKEWPEPVTLRRQKKPTIVFLHGFGSSAEIFEHQLRYFSALGYPCIAPDMLGHGMSSAPGRPRDYHFGKLLGDLDVVLHHYAFKPGEKCVLVAHNYGCSFATALAYKYDSNIHQLVLISGGGPTPLAPPSTESAGHGCLRAILAPLLMCGLHRDILYSARGRQHPYCGEESEERLPSHMKYVLDGMIWPEGDYVFHRKICTPTLLVHGLRDSKVSLVQECQMERTIVKAFLEAIPMAGHCPMTECPQQLNHMIHCFIDLWKNKKCSDDVRVRV